MINKYLAHDEYQLEIKDSIGDKDFYQCVSMRAGVQGTVKNIIFAARYKPEIVFDNALNNDIRITRNADKCLIYDRPIPQNGLLWSELVEWFAAKTDTVENVENRWFNSDKELITYQLLADGIRVTVKSGTTEELRHLPWLR